MQMSLSAMMLQARRNFSRELAAMFAPYISETVKATSKPLAYLWKVFL